MHHLFGVCTLKKDIHAVEMVQRRAICSILSSCINILSLPKCYGTPATIQLKDAGTNVMDAHIGKCKGTGCYYNELVLA